MVGVSNKNHEKLEQSRNFFITKINIHVIFSSFTKFLNHKHLELYGTLEILHYTRTYMYRHICSVLCKSCNPCSLRCKFGDSRCVCILVFTCGLIIFVCVCATFVLVV